MTEVDRTATIPLPGDRVADKEADENEESTAIVLEVYPDTAAVDYYLPAIGTTVGEVNENYPPESPVVTVGYVSDLNAQVFNWEDIPIDELQSVLQANNVRTYDFPVARLNLLAAEDPQREDSNSERQSDKGRMEGNAEDQKEYDLSTVPDRLPTDGSGDNLYVRKRTQYLKRVSKLRPAVCKALAYREIGYSSSGIAKEMETTESTVSSWFDEIKEEYGKDALETRPQSNPIPELE